MTKTRSIPAMAAAAGVALALLTGAGAAQARDVNWSIGVNSPGVSVGVSNGYGYPVYVAPPPVYVAPRPIYYAPPPPRVYSAPPPAVRAAESAPFHQRPQQATLCQPAQIRCHGAEPFGDFEWVFDPLIRSWD